MIKNKIVPIIRWKPIREKYKQCLADSLANYDTLCGTDCNDPGCTNEIGSKTIEKMGRVTCNNCLRIIEIILKYYD